LLSRHQWFRRWARGTRMKERSEIRSAPANPRQSLVEELSLAVAAGQA
jgi:hypothetical protein